MYQPNFCSVPFRLGLYPIVNNTIWVKRMIKSGVKNIQLRIKNKKNKEIEDEIANAIRLSFFYNVRLFINDYWYLAIKYKAYGVHLGQDDLKNADLDLIKKAKLRLGISTRNNLEVNLVKDIRPSYIAYGHIFPTNTKLMNDPPQGLKQLSYYIKNFKDCPSVAIGGINIDRVPDVLSTGVGGIAVISAIINEKNWKISTLNLLKLIGQGDNE